MTSRPFGAVLTRRGCSLRAGSPARAHGFARWYGGQHWGRQEATSLFRSQEQESGVGHGQPMRLVVGLEGAELVLFWVSYHPGLCGVICAL